MLCLVDLPHVTSYDIRVYLSHAHRVIAYSMLEASFLLTFATVMLNLSKAGVTANPSSRSRSPCRKNSSHALCDHSRDTLHGLHKHNNISLITLDFNRF